MQWGDDDFQGSTSALSVDPSATESPEGNQTEFSMSVSEMTQYQKNEKQLNRLTYQKILNLKALISATQFIDDLLAYQNQPEVNFSVTDLPVLRNTLNTHELVKEAQKILEKTQKPVVKHVTAVTTTKLDFQSEVITSPTKRAVSLLTKIFQAENKHFVEVFTEPVNKALAPSYYQVIRQPMCFAFVAMRMRATQEDGGIIQDTQLPQNILIGSHPEQYGSMIEQLELFNGQQAGKSFAHLVRSGIYSQLRRKPFPYEFFDEILADLLLIAADCCYFNNHNEHYCSLGRRLFEAIKDVFQKQNLWNPIYDDLLQIDVITKVCAKIERTIFDDLIIDELSDETVKKLVALVGAEDSDAQRERISKENMNKTIQFIQEKHLIERQSRQRILTIKQFSQDPQLTQAGTARDRNSVDEQNVLDEHS